VKGSPALDTFHGIATKKNVFENVGKGQR